MRRRRACVWYFGLAVLHVVMLIVQAPHLVHHAFEHHSSPPDECAFAAAADHGHGLVPDASLVPGAADPTGPFLLTAPAAARGRAVEAAPARAPPRFSA